MPLDHFLSRRRLWVFEAVCDSPWPDFLLFQTLTPLFQLVHDDNIL